MCIHLTEDPRCIINTQSYTNTIHCYLTVSECKSCCWHSRYRNEVCSFSSVCRVVRNTVPPTLRRTHLPLLPPAVLTAEPFPMIFSAPPDSTAVDVAVVAPSLPSLSLLLLLLLLLLFRLLCVAERDPVSGKAWGAAVFPLSSVAIRELHWGWRAVCKRGYQCGSDAVLMPCSVSRGEAACCRFCSYHRSRISAAVDWLVSCDVLVPPTCPLMHFWRRNDAGCIYALTAMDI